MTKQLESQIRAGKVAAKAHKAVEELIKPGINCLEIEKKVGKIIAEADMKPAFKGYKGYPAVTCISVNSVVVHGIPESRVLLEGDIVSVDLGVSCAGWLVDTAQTYKVGKVDPRIDKLLQITELALEKAIEKCRIGNRVGDIASVVQNTVESAGFHVVKELTGHGVGRELQEKPSIPNFGVSHTGSVLKEGMVIAVEPITTLEPASVRLAEDNWTIYSQPAVPSAHFEHTVAITSDGPIVLTR